MSTEANESSGITIGITPTGKTGKVAMTLNLEGDPNFPIVKKFDLLDEPCRQRVLMALGEKIPALAEPKNCEMVERVMREEAAALAYSLGDQHTKRSFSEASVSQPSPNELLDAMPEDIRTKAEAMLINRDLISLLINDIATLGVAGECELTATIYLIGTSRLLKRPLAGIIKGPTSSGKSYIIDQTAKLFPPEAIIHATQMTPKALFHMPPGSLEHRFIVAGERSRLENDETAEATRALREMISSGRLSKLMPMKGDGKLETVHIEQEGPIAYIESTTLAKIFEEDANRCLILHTDEQAEQTRRIIRQIAAGYSEGENSDQERIIQLHYALQRMLETFPVIIPYADRLGELFSTDNVEVRRAFPQVMSMIESITLLHQRQRKRDDQEILIATAEDYHLTRHLLTGPMSRILGTGLPEPSRRFFHRVAAWFTGPFTSSQAKQKETGSKSAVYGWLGDVHEAGLIEVEEPGRGRKSTLWKFTGKAPEEIDASGLPSVEEVFPDVEWTHGHKAQTVENQ